MIQETRREKEVEEMKRSILNAAHQIIAQEGFDKVSIRKIANMIEYSPSIIYHYFKDKNEILDHAMRQRYQTITSAIASVPTSADPLQTLQIMSRNYIETAVQMGDEFLMAQLRPTAIAKQHTASLFAGAAKVKPALGMLCDCLRQLHPSKADQDLERMAQLIVTSTLGLVLKLIVENEIGEEQKKQLIDLFCSEVVLRIAGTG